MVSTKLKTVGPRDKLNYEYKDMLLKQKTKKTLKLTEKWQFKNSIYIFFVQDRDGTPDTLRLLV